MRREVKRAATNSISLAIAMQVGAGIGGIYEISWVAWIQLQRALEIPQRFRPPALTPVRQGELEIKRSVVRQGPAGKLELSARTIVVTKATSQIICADEMNFTGIRLKLTRPLDVCLRALKMGGG